MLIASLQVWMPALNQSGLDALQKQLYSDPELCIMGSPALMTFRLSRQVHRQRTPAGVKLGLVWYHVLLMIAKHTDTTASHYSSHTVVRAVTGVNFCAVPVLPCCCRGSACSCQRMQYGHQGMPGRVLRSGCVQVVQNLRIIPEVLHPRCRLPEAVSAGVGEVLYIPVFDLHAPHAGPVAVLEALLSATATDSMLVANFISVVGNVLSCLQVGTAGPGSNNTAVAMCAALSCSLWQRSLCYHSPGSVLHSVLYVVVQIYACTVSASVDSCPVLVCLSFMPVAQLSLSNPLPQPVKRSKLEGRKPRPIHHDSSQDLTHARTQQEQQLLAQQQVPGQPSVQEAQHAVQQPAEAMQQSSFAAAACSPADGFCQPEHLPAHQQLQLQLTRSGSSGSAGTIVAAPSAGTPTSSPVDHALDSTVSSRLRDSCPGHASAAPARTSAEFPPAGAPGAMLPPRPCAAGAVRLLQRRRWQQEGDTMGADGSEDSDASPPPNKLRRMTEPAHMSSMARTKSVPLGLDQVLLNAMGGCEPAASC